METIDCAVIGAGVVGIAIARALALAGREVLVLEAADAIGTHTSSRNSEVIHAGLYYPRGSLKAQLCVSGRAALYAYCEARGVPFRRIGKIVVATDESELPAVRSYAEAGAANGVGDLRWLTRAELAEMEPAVWCVAGFHSPSTGIVDSHALMLALQGDAENAGAIFAFNAPVVAAAIRNEGIELDVGGAEPTTLACRAVVNAAGLFAPDLARAIAGLPAAHVPPPYYAKAHYYTLAGANPFRRLVYPIASHAHLGVHLTIDLAGRARFGPDVSWIDGVDYAFDESRAASFYAAIRRYWPALPDGALQPGYTGIRPKISGPNAPAADFRIDGPGAHGVPGLVNLFGIESPGLTACLAIAAHVCGLLGGDRRSRE